ncbi:MAG TPA: ATP-dependent helicase HrpB [Kiritimatiellia bacterium]|nr:ATP-dependent helicase HrpB [Kiritimatiellia bacterium]
MPSSLPIYDIETRLLEALPRHRRLVVAAPTGSGKSTQVPQMLLDRGLLGDGHVVVLQPRRLATRLLAARVAEERGVALGAEVGYQIRLENITSAQTRIKFVTEGILLRAMLSDPSLTGISTLIFDEFHERHLYGDITLGRALDIQATRRPDLNIIVMSATLAVEQMQAFLAPCDVVESQGRTFPVDLRYLPHASDAPVWEQAAEAFETLVRGGAEGDALIFMPGAYEISRTVQTLEHTPAARGCLILPLHGELNPRDQDAAVARYDRRKIVVATNVAETSLTIDGIRMVIDAGLARIPRYDPYRGINTLLVEKISRASADQRAGRAGRTAPGIGYRLWTEREHRERPAQELPEIKRLDLSEVVLTLKASGVDQVRAFRWIEPPEERSIHKALQLLSDLGAISATGEDAGEGPITPLGRRMISFPVHPRYARMLLAGERFGCVYQACLLAALTQGRDILMRRQGGAVSDERDDLLGESAVSDFFRLVRAWHYADKNGYRLDACKRLGVHAQSARQVKPLLEHFLRIARQEGLDPTPRPVDDSEVQKCILSGFSDQLARRLDEGTLRCQLVHNRRGQIARESVVKDHPLVVAAEVHEIEGKDREVNVLLSLCTAVEPEWLRELFPEHFREAVAVSFDSATKRVLAEKQVLFRDLPLESKRIDPPPPDAAADLLAAEVIKGALALKQWDHGVEQWIQRVNNLAAWCPELGVTAITDDDRHTMIAQVCYGAVSYKDIKEKEVWPVVREWLNHAQQHLLDQYCPERITLPNGRKAKVTYTTESPFVSLRIQELYGIEDRISVARGRIPVLVHILAPSQRPVQITQDLAGFWREHYPRIKQELQRKYPKHEWR